MPTLRQIKAFDHLQELISRYFSAIPPYGPHPLIHPPTHPPTYLTYPPTSPPSPTHLPSHPPTSPTYPPTPLPPHEIRPRIPQSPKKPRDSSTKLRPSVNKSPRTAPGPVKIMEVCGGHTHSIFKYGLESLLPPTVELVHGPGCPVCIMPKGRLDDAIAPGSAS